MEEDWGLSVAMPEVRVSPRQGGRLGLVVLCTIRFEQLASLSQRRSTVTSGAHTSQPCGACKSSAGEGLEAADSVIAVAVLSPIGVDGLALHKSALGDPTILPSSTHQLRHAIFLET